MKLSHSLVTKKVLCLVMSRLLMCQALNPLYLIGFMLIANSNVLLFFEVSNQ